VNDILDISRLEAGGMKLEKDNYHLSEIINSIEGRLAKLTEHHRLTINVPSELPEVYVDEGRIGQVITNLVENAAKYAPEGSEISIGAEQASDEIIVSVTDEGEGVPPELQDKLFDRFYQTESIVTGRKKGTGLGLSICKGIVEIHGGRIWVESKLGEGAKFSFSLPSSRRR
jgi:two-component system sensor histidine kinase KdpD